MTVHRDDEELPIFAPKLLAVLAVLLLQANRVVTSEQLFSLVWGNHPPRSVRGRLQVHVSELRALLGTDVITRVGNGYKINVAPGELDLQVFTDAVAQAQNELRAGKACEAARRLRSALALWRGPALSSVAETLIQHERPGLEDRRLSALEELFDAELAAGNHPEIVDQLRRAVANNPFREKLTAQLMLALHRSDRRTEALEVYTDTHRRLVDELGIEPGQRLRDTHMRVLQGDPTSAGAENEGDSPSDVGDPEPSRTACLPRDIQGFAGREDVLAILDARLTAGDGSCVISGIAGVGKTALAVHWAHTVREHFPDGQLYLNLRGFDQEHGPVAPVSAMGTLLSSLGVAPRRIPETLAGRTALYRSMLADRRVLVLLDNARDTAQVVPLLPPSGSVLVTSRSRLGDLTARVGAHVISLPVLTDKESYALLAAVLGAEAAEPERGAELVRLCAGLPLALRIASANILTNPTASISSVTTELTTGGPFAALTTDGTEQSAVRSAFSASYRALEPEHQRIFRLLGLVPGPDFTAEAAAALADIPLLEADRGLRALAACSVIEQHAGRRYRFHDLIRLYALEEARSDPERGPAWVRLVGYYLRSAKATAEHYSAGTLRLPRETPAHPAHTHTEHLGTCLTDVEVPNVTAAAILAAKDGPYPAAWLLTDCLRTYHHRTGRRAEWLEIAPVLLDAARRHDESDVQALLHHSIGTCFFRAGQRDKSLHHVNEAIRLAQACRWGECEAASLADLGIALGWIGRPAEAVTHIQRALTLFSELGLIMGESRAQKYLGLQYHFLGKLRLAEEHYLRALGLVGRHGNRFTHAVDLLYLGAVRTPLGKLTKAESNLRRAVDMFHELGSSGGSAVAHTWLSQLYWEAGDLPRARMEAERARQRSRASGGRLAEALALIAATDAETSLGEYTAAEEHLASAMAIVGRGNFIGHEVMALCAAARLAVRRGSYPVAVLRAKQAHAAAHRHNYLALEVPALVVLTDAYLHMGESEQAVSTGREALALARGCGLANDERRLQGLLEGDGPGTG
nr:BTAD domain-containing putative transcriptional regulator [Pseudonocardia acaciae]